MTNPLQKLLPTLVLAMAALASNAWAAKPAPAAANPQLTADTQAATARYASDKKLCNDEATSSARLQCRRDAKAEFDQTIASAKAKAGAIATSPAPVAPVAQTPPTSGVAPKPAPAQAACVGCGRVMAIAVTEKAGDASAVGMLAGGALGALLGNQVGEGAGKSLATLAGAAGGVYAGKMIEEKMKTHKVWTVTVHYDNESKASFEFAADPGLQVGDHVKNSGNSIVRQ